MREGPMIAELISLDDLGGVDNIVAMPNLMNGRLAVLLAAASAPIQEHELRGELAARTAFQAAVSSWPNSKRRLRRTPAAIAVTTVATMLVATTSLAAASVLPGPANRAVGCTRHRCVCVRIAHPDRPRQGRHHACGLLGRRGRVQLGVRVDPHGLLHHLRAPLKPGCFSGTGGGRTPGEAYGAHSDRRNPAQRVPQHRHPPHRSQALRRGFLERTRSEHPAGDDAGRRHLAGWEPRWRYLQGNNNWDRHRGDRLIDTRGRQHHVE